jgi:hypothetical protein
MDNPTNPESPDSASTELWGVPFVEVEPGTMPNPGLKVVPDGFKRTYRIRVKAPEGWKTKRPVPLIVEKQGETFVVSDSVSCGFGIADTLEGAVEEYIEDLTMYYKALQENSTYVVQEHLDFLSEYIERCPAHNGESKE